MSVLPFKGALTPIGSPFYSKVHVSCPQKAPISLKSCSLNQQALLTQNAQELYLSLFIGLIIFIYLSNKSSGLISKHYRPPRLGTDIRK